jgi:hypothetical protein
MRMISESFLIILLSRSANEFKFLIEKKLSLEDAAISLPSWLAT